MKNITFQHLCWIACERKNRLVAEVTTSANSVLEALQSYKPSEHATFNRVSYNDCNGWICYVSNLGHIFMVQAPAI